MWYSRSKEKIVPVVVYLLLGLKSLPLVKYLDAKIFQDFLRTSIQSNVFYKPRFEIFKSVIECAVESMEQRRPPE